MPTINIPTKWMNFEQENETLLEMGLEWRSTFNNWFSLLLTFLLLIFIHIWIKLSPSFRKIKEERRGKCARIWIKTRTKILEYFSYVVYVRMMLEAHQSILLSGITELDTFNLESVASIVSFTFAGIVVTISFLLVAKSYLLLYKYWNNFDPNQKFFFMEFYADIRESKWARCYTSVLLTRRLLIILMVLLMTFINRNIIFSLILGIQLIYFSLLVTVRPFGELENNVIEITNETFLTTFIWLMLNWNKSSRWTSTITTTFISLITANSLIITIISLSKSFFLIFSLYGNCNYSEYHQQA
jgi:hypothetical protein